MCNGHSLVASYSSPNFFRLDLVHKKVWCSLSSLNVQTRVLAMTFHITLLKCEFLTCFKKWSTSCIQEQLEVGALETKLDFQHWYVIQFNMHLVF